jgi:hypothetical protein
MNDAERAGVLNRLLEPVTRCLNAESARLLVDARADPAAEARISTLAERCNQGQLTTDERREYETYVHAGNLIAILQAKARLHLNKKTAA